MHFLATHTYFCLQEKLFNKYYLSGKYCYRWYILKLYIYLNESLQLIIRFPKCRFVCNTEAY